MADARPERRMTLKRLDMGDVDVGSTNVRRREITAGIDELARSLGEIGLQQPLVVQPSNSHFDVLVGQRRFLAAKKLGWKEIDALVPAPPFSDVEAVQVSFSENVQRRDLEPADKAEAVEFLLGKLKTVRAVANALGVSEPTVRKWHGYRSVPESIKQLVVEKRLSAPVAIRISQALPDEERALRVAEHIASVQPAKATRDRILDSVEDNSDRPVEVILERAVEAQDEVVINFVLTAHWARSMSTASAQTKRDPEELARDATVDWLERNRF